MENKFNFVDIRLKYNLTLINLINIIYKINFNI